MIALQKPTYYLWRTDYTSSEDFEADKEKYRKIGFRVVAFADGQPDKNIHNGIKISQKFLWGGRYSLASAVNIASKIERMMKVHKEMRWGNLYREQPKK